ncbi:hypothetical protein F53441_1713 [Fusarium austroafricanum]|uniref:Uncharacterized protein n=1 Tax=Fusarium austroafricanum TaxID=2364996 RepID=A0A8H4KUR1_9HYPO|nr:hypothetical protein F53441_1713 [Fusarium austroafricanum]
MDRTRGINFLTLEDVEAAHAHMLMSHGIPNEQPRYDTPACGNRPAENSNCCQDCQSCKDKEKTVHTHGYGTRAATKRKQQQEEEEEKKKKRRKRKKN